VLFTLEWTVARAMVYAELELVSSAALARSSTRSDEVRLTIERDVRVTAFGPCADRSRWCWAPGATPGKETTKSIGGAGGIGCGETASTSTGSAPTTATGSLGEPDGGAASSAAGAVAGLSTVEAGEGTESWTPATWELTAFASATAASTCELA
jgi:hypothetical protein